MQKFFPSQNRKIPSIDANALSDNDDSSNSGSDSSYVELTDTQRQQPLHASGVPPRPSRTSRYTSKLMGKGPPPTTAPVSLGRDASRLSVGSLD